MKQSLYYLNDDETWFPPIHQALDEPPGLLAVGGDLSLLRLKKAYFSGIFPWYSDNEPLLWWSPDPRAIIEIDEIRLNKSLKKFLRKCRYQVSINRSFNNVIQQCALPRSEDNGTWIFPEMQDAYQALHNDGTAHSIEVWETQNEQKQLVGGLYGVAVGSCFCGESMFSSKPNASKLALLVLGQLLKPFKNALIDCQLPNPYLMSMGAKTVPRELFVERLNAAKKDTLPADVFSVRDINWREVVPL